MERKQNKLHFSHHARYLVPLKCAKDERGRGKDNLAIQPAGRSQPFQYTEVSEAQLQLQSVVEASDPKTRKRKAAKVANGYGEKHIPKDVEATGCLAQILELALLTFLTHLLKSERWNGAERCKLPNLKRRVENPNPRLSSQARDPRLLRQLHGGSSFPTLSKKQVDQQVAGQFPASEWPDAGHALTRTTPGLARSMAFSFASSTRFKPSVDSPFAASDPKQRGKVSSAFNSLARFRKGFFSFLFACCTAFFAAPSWSLRLWSLSHSSS